MAGQGIIESLTSPEVPIAAGIAAILGATSGTRASASQYAALVASTAEAAAISALQSAYDSLMGFEWGLFDTSGQPSFADSIVSMLTGSGSSGGNVLPNALVAQVSGNLSRVVSVAPVQNGSFVAYNKVANPEQVQIGLSFQGNAAAKAAQFAKLEGYLNGTDLLTVRMPGLIRKNMNVVGINFMRSAKSGADLLMPVATLQEIRVYASTSVMTTKSGSNTSTVDRGAIQTQAPTAAQSQAINS